MALTLSRTLRWQSPIGRDTIQRIVKLKIPGWTEGLRDWQLDLISRILDGEDILVSTATGDGKSAIFAVPLVVLLELKRQPAYYPNLLRRALPMGIVITPTKGLAGNIVFEISKFGVHAVAYTSEVLTEARKTGRQLWKEIALGQWPLVCIDPEHLTAKDWEQITNNETWRENIAFLCVDEIHLVHEWGADFRPAFRFIGMFARSRCPPHISVFGLSATMEPGMPTSTICDTMGLIPGHFYHLQRTNERANIHFILQTLSHTLGGDTFPDLLPFLASGRKTVIYCETIELCFRVAIYLWSLLPPGLEKLTRVRLYHAMCWPDENEETIRLIRDDPHCQVVIATVAFAQGINVKPLLDCIQLGVPSTMNQLVQQEGRIGRDGVSLARGVVLAQAKAVESAENYMRAHFPSEMGPPPLDPKKSVQAKPAKKAVTRMDISKARLLSARGCLTALRNVTYHNPPLEQTRLDCVIARRAVPCGRCLPLTDIILEFSAPAELSPLPPFRTPRSSAAPSSASSIPAPQKRELALTGKMREEVTRSLDHFRDSVRKLEKGLQVTGRTPRAAYFPTPLATQIAINLMAINTIGDIEKLIPDWEYLPRHATHLFEHVSQLQATFRAQHEDARLVRNEKNRLRAKAKREAANGAIDEEVETEAGVVSMTEKEPPVVGPSDVVHPSSAAPTKRPALADDTNMVAPKRARRGPRPLESSSEVTQSFGPFYRPRSDRSRRSCVTDENTTL
ncbi:P-loop containing nucleoside triphosphate hydrolase protein [Lyophyllum atratum]|nr:P-loop containing nucleoside triphosphate hydrolase protein [Lyophyllum atratum]